MKTVQILLSGLDFLKLFWLGFILRWFTSLPERSQLNSWARWMKMWFSFHVFFLLRLKKKPANLAFSLQFLPLAWEAGSVLIDGLSTWSYRVTFRPPRGDKALPGFSGWPFLALQGPLPYLFVKNLTRIPRNVLDFIQYETDSRFLEFSLLFSAKGNQEINASVYVWNKDWTGSFSKLWLSGHFSSAPIWSTNIRQTV